MSAKSRRHERNLGKSKLTIVPCDLDEANIYVKQIHRHLDAVEGCKFCLAVADETSQIRGVCIVGKPVARGNNDGWTLEAYRVATDGCPNACSALYAAAQRITFALGYDRFITYTLVSEPGTSVKAVRMREVKRVKGRSWSCPSRPRIDKHPLQDKIRWEITA